MKFESLVSTYILVTLSQDSNVECDFQIVGIATPQLVSYS